MSLLKRQVQGYTAQVQRLRGSPTLTYDHRRAPKHGTSTE